VIDYFHTGAIVQHVVPAWDLRALYATNNIGNSLTPIDPNTGRRAGPNIPVADPYNMYFTPDGRHAIVVEEARQTLAFRDPHTFALQKTLPVQCLGVDHMDFSADGTFALASCEFSGQMVRVDLRTDRIAGYLRVGGSPQDVKLSPGGRTFYVANRYLPDRGASGVQLIDARRMHVVGFIRTRLDAHGLYVSRNTRELYVTDRAGGAVTVLDVVTRRVVAVWPVPGTPDMGGSVPTAGCCGSPGATAAPSTRSQPATATTSRPSPPASRPTACASGPNRGATPPATPASCGESPPLTASDSSVRGSTSHGV
jgi:DNA-binding beta-propeller fold protein YncE